MITKLGKVVIYLQGFLSFNTPETLITWSWLGFHVTNKKYISITTIPMANKLGIVVTYHEELIKLPHQVTPSKSRNHVL